MKRIYLYVPKTGKGALNGKGLNDMLMDMSVPLMSSYPVTRENASVVPMWAHEAGIQIPVDHPTAQLLKQWNVPANIVPLPPVHQQEIRQYQQENNGLLGNVNFNALASLLMKVLLEYMDGKARRQEPWYKQAIRIPATIAQNYFENKANPVNKQSFLQKAAPVIGTIANTFMPGTGTAIKLGLNGINWLKNRFLGGKRGKKKRKSIFVYNNGTRQYLGQKVSFENDIKKVADNAFKKKAEDNKWRKFISTAFSSAIKKVAPAIEAGRLVLGKKIKKSQIKMVRRKRRGGSSNKDYMAWVRSFKRKGKRGKGVKYKPKTKKGIHWVGAGKKVHVYNSHGIIYPKPIKKHTKKKGKGLVSSGDIFKGNPFDYSGMPPYF